MVKWFLAFLSPLLIFVLLGLAWIIFSLSPLTVYKVKKLGQEFTYIITETGPWTSLDPLQGDSTQNLPIQRMIYATPLEISQSNQLVSSVLESFSYDLSSKRMTWRVKRHLEFDDGEPLTTEDVAFSVLRMAYKRPEFPVIESIQGLQEWLAQEFPLQSWPSGITVDGQQIEISFDQDVKAPLFRFSLELFSIIPKRCVDLKTSRLLCERPPASGHYRLLKEEPRRFTFEKRGGPKVEGREVPPILIFEYRSPDQIPLEPLLSEPRTVVAGAEFHYSEEALQSLKDSHDIRFMPAARFLALLLNPRVQPFSSRNCRRVFARAFRGAYSRLRFGIEGAAEGSIFTKILPGYLSIEELSKGSNLASGSSEECLEVSPGQEISWAYVKGEAPDLYIESLRVAAQEVGLPLASPQVVENRKELGTLFAEGGTSIMPGSSGFWAHDPAGDLRMLFTPNLHAALSDLGRDVRLQQMVKEVEQRENGFREVNQYLFDEAVFNVYAHVRRFYLAGQGGQIGEPPFALVLPAPWQVFQAQ